MRNRHKLLILLLAALVAAGCAGLPEKQLKQVAAPVADSLLYNTLVAEIAGHSGNLKQAVKYYRKVVATTNNPDIAQRAARIMLFAKDYEATRATVRRWLELAPGDIEARQMAATISLRQGDVAAATISLEWLLEFAKDKQQGFKLLAVLLERVTDKQVAANAMRQMASRYPGIIEAQIFHARLAYAAKQYEKSAEAAGRALQIDAESLEAKIILARAQVELGNTDKALHTLGSLLEQDLDNGGLRLIYARMLVAVNRFESAIEQFELLLDKTPDNADIVYSAALISMQVKSYTAAENYLKKLLALGKHQQRAWFYLGRLEEKRKSYKKAQEWYARIDAENLYIDAQTSTARVQGKSGQLENARNRYALLRDSHPEYATSIWLSESEMLRELDHNEEAYDLLSRAVEQHPSENELLYSRALAAERIDRIDILETDLKLILQREPEHAHALNALGYTLADRTDRYDEAQAYILKAFKLKPNDPAIIDSMGWIQYRLGNLDKAIEFLKQANEALQDGEVAAHLGEVLWVRGDHEAANALWTEALREYPDSKILIKVINRFKPR